MFECDKKADPEYSETVIINVDYIETIIPEGETCLIRMIPENDSIRVAHSAAWVMGLINGNCK